MDSVGISQDKLIDLVTSFLEKKADVLQVVETRHAATAALPASLRERIVNGYTPQRSGDLVIINKSGYSQQIVIPNHLLYGYDPLQCNRLGISYRINRKNHFPMHFSAVTEDFSIDQQPSMWATCNLVNN